MGRLYIAEKPAVGQAIAAALGGGQTQRGYIQVGNDRVTWCIGHLLRLKEPHEYDAALEKWELDKLPIIHVPWQWLPSGDAGTKQQLKTVLALLKEASEVVHAGDPDDEGQLIVDNILDFAGNRLPVRRALINDNSLKPVQKALSSLEDNSKFVPMGRRALARTVGDQVYGISMTRAVTLVARAMGYQDTLHVGRVSNGIGGLVVRRDRAHESHEKIQYFTVQAGFSINGASFPGRYDIQENDPVLDELVGNRKQIGDQGFAERVVAEVRNQTAVISSSKTDVKEQHAPLPYNLLKLQADAAKKFNISPKDVMEITQNLKDKHQLITYNRSDCQYLREEQHEAAPAVLGAIAKTAPMLAGAANAANPEIKGRVFNSAKTSAHHAIIPTENAGNFDALNDAERKIYMLVARAYIAQFFPKFSYKQTKLELECAGYAFTSSSRVPLVAGWKQLYRNDADNEDVVLDSVDFEGDLSVLNTGDQGTCDSSSVSAQETKPPKRYTVDTLLLDLARAAKYIRDPELRARLVDRDKEKEGEQGGIGTPATRDSHLDNLFTRGYMKLEGKSIVSTPALRNFYDTLPDYAKWPDLSAIWEGQFQQIEDGELTPVQFVQQLSASMSEEIKRIRTDGLDLKVQIFRCPNCDRPLRLFANGKNGPFWGCTGYKEGCKASFKDQGGAPALVRQEYKCPECTKPLRRIPSQTAPFWSCTGRPACNVTLPDNHGAPGERKKQVVSQFKCQKCERPLVKRNQPGTAGRVFWGCSGFTQGCRTSYPDQNGRPQFGTTE